MLNNNISQNTELIQHKIFYSKLMEKQCYTCITKLQIFLFIGFQKEFLCTFHKKKCVLILKGAEWSYKMWNVTWNSRDVQFSGQKKYCLIYYTV